MIFIKFTLFSLLFFDKYQTIVTASAPGRLDVMGGIADYSGALVLQMPIRERATVQAAFREDGLLRVHSAAVGQIFEAAVGGLPEEYGPARLFFKQRAGGEWAAYILGCLLVLKNEKGIPIGRGIDFRVTSEVPVGKGVSSSAALEIATMRALGQLYGLEFEGTEMAVLAQKAENLVVGAPCGLMDQLASCFGQTGHLLPIRCQPDQLLDLVKIPAGVSFVGLDSGIRHAVSGATYSGVRTAAFMGYSIIARFEGAGSGDLRQARLSGRRDGLPFGGYLCNIQPSDFEKKYLALLPEVMSGEEFLETFGEMIDPVTRVDAGANYHLRACTKHPVYENSRVQKFAGLLQQPLAPALLRQLGGLMYQAHESYSACGLGNSHTDELVDRVKAAGVGSGVFGAKITGGGSGGTVCVLCHGAGGLAAVAEIFEGYQSKRGGGLQLIHS